MQIFILGMHRSGTSSLARLLNMMGAYFAPEGLSTLANEENPKGFWERRDIRQSNDKLLFSKGYDWNRISTFSLDLLPDDAKLTYQQEISRILLEMDAHRPWLIKEPRLCLLFPLWRPLLEVPVCVHIYRNPLEVALSLKKRNDIPLHTGIALWEKYNLLALEASTDIPRLCVSFTEIIENPTIATLNIFNSLEQLGVKGIRLPSDNEISNFISTDLYRNRLNDLNENEFLNTKQIELFSLFKKGTIFENFKINSFSNGCNALLDEYEQNQSLLKEIKNDHIQQISTIESENIKKEENYEKQLLNQNKNYTEKLNKEKTILEELLEKDKILHEEQLKQQSNNFKKQQRLHNNKYLEQIKSIKTQYATLESSSADWERKSEILSNQLTSAHIQQNLLKSELTAFKKRKIVKAVEKIAPIARHGKKFLRQPRQTLSPYIKKNLSSLRHLRRRTTYPKIIANIKKLRPDDKITDGPLVSIIILTRNGYHHMKRLLKALEDNTSYKNFEVIVVDNGSTDSTIELFKIQRKFELHLIGNTFNASFSQANNQAAEIAKGTLLLFLNNDIEPINSSWLGALVESLKDKHRVAAGALLIYPAGTTTSGISPQKNVDLTVQHKCIQFEWRHNVPHPINISGDQQPDHPELTQLKPVPAVTAACIMVKAEQFNQVKGFDELYVYGSEDVDLCLKLGQQCGEIVFVGEAALFHYESATQDTLLSKNIKKINRTGNWQFFIERWGTYLNRKLRQEITSDTNYWLPSKNKKIAFTVIENNNSSDSDDCRMAYDLGAAFSNMGWEVIYLERYNNRWSLPPQDIDIIISLLDQYDPRTAPSRTTTIAWLGNETDRWLNKSYLSLYDRVVVSRDSDADILQQATGERPPVIPPGSDLKRFKTLEPDPTYQCDFAFIGNFQGSTRNLFTFLTVLKDEKFFLFGKGWEKTPWLNRYWRWHLPFKEHCKLYTSSKIIIHDTSTHSLPNGILTSHIFDALACGALVVSNDHKASKEYFDGMLPTYDSPKQLRDLLNIYLNNNSLRKNLVKQLSHKVIEDYTIDLVYNNFQTLLKQEVERLKIAIKTCVPKKEDAAIWGDTHFAECFSRALKQEGYQTAIHIMPEWNLPENQDVDIVIHLRGLNAYIPKPAAFNILWVISHPDAISIEECQSYDLILVASHLFAKNLAEKVDVPVYPFLQATDEKRFTPLEPDESIQSELLFVGNTRNQVRPCINWASELNKDLHIYGSGWDQTDIPTEYIKGEYYANDKLNGVYSSTKILLNDHWSDMKKYGFISNRIFDALACGTFIISDEIPEIRELFQDVVPTFKDKADFKKKINSFLDQDAKRKELTAIGQDIVLSEHTFKVRGQQLKELINKHFKNSK